MAVFSVISWYNKEAMNRNGGVLGMTEMEKMLLEQNKQLVTQIALLTEQVQVLTQNPSGFGFASKSLFLSETSASRSASN